MKKYLLTLLVFLVLLAASCSVPEAGVKPKVVKPDGDKSTVTGRVVDADSGQPVDTIVRLAQVYRQEDSPGAYVLDEGNSPGTFTDADGYFIIENVPPIEYVIVIGYTDVYLGYEVIPTADGKPKVFQFEAGQILDVGEVTVTLDR